MYYVDETYFLISCIIDTTFSCSHLKLPEHMASIHLLSILAGKELELLLN